MFGKKNVRVSKVVGLLVLLGVNALLLSGCSLFIPPAEFSNRAAISSQVVSEVRDHVPSGYEVSEIWGNSYSIDHQDPNSYFTLLAGAEVPELAKQCKTILRWAEKLGAQGYSSDFNKPDPIKTYEAQAQAGCVNTLANSIRLPGDIEPRGSTSFNIFGTYEKAGKRAPFQISMNAFSNQPNSQKYVYSIRFGTQMDYPNTVRDKMHRDQLGRSLDAVGAYRLAHPELEYFDEASFAAATKSVPSKNFTPVVSSDGKVHYAFQYFDTEKTGRYSLCVSIDPWQTKFAGVANPGSGYMVGYVDSFDQSRQFGIAVGKECPKD